MKQIPLIFFFAALWASSGLLLGVSLAALFDLEWQVPCLSLNLVAGLVLLLLVTRNETARRLFYEGPRDNEQGSVLIGMLWAFPFVLAFVGIIWWMLGQLLN